nr:immunoglobulin heavy chain junction region [Mus musculus]
LCKTGTCYGLL